MQAASPVPDTRCRPARILIVDDERPDRQLLDVMLAPEGYDLLAAASGEEALAIMEQERPDLILLDVMMPGMDGYQLASKIKSNPATRNIPVIMITALGDHAARLLGLSAGAVDFCTKPIDRAELCVRVKNLLRLTAHGEDAGSSIGTFSSSTDVTGQTRGIEALGKAEERMRFALRNANVGIWDMDYASQSVRWSDVLEAQYGVPEGTFAGTFAAFVERIHPEDRASVLDTIGNAMKSGTDFTVQNRSVMPDGTVRWLSGAGRFQLDEHGEPVRGVGISQDVSEQHAMESRYRQAHKMEAVGQLASGVAHDFNNLLTVILGCAQLVSQDASVAKRHGEDLDEIIKAARRAGSLTRQLLAFGRRQEDALVPLDVNALVREMTGMLNRLIGEHIEIVLALWPDASPAIVDRGQLEQVVMNLVVNARDAMLDGGRVTIVTSNVELGVSSLGPEAVVPGPYTMLSIADTGCGMTKETQRRLFEPFFTTKDAGKGTGLGLSTTYSIVKQSKGYIQVDSTPGVGTTFKIYFPRVPGDVPVPAESHEHAYMGSPLLA